MENASLFFLVIGGGLAGCEAALALARNGHFVRLYEQKPLQFSPAHTSPHLAELVCSNSFRSDDATRTGVGLLKEEMRSLGSAVMDIAQTCTVPAGQALAVDRDAFAASMTHLIEQNPRITLIRQPIHTLEEAEALHPIAIILAAGPLASDSLIQSLAPRLPSSSLYFYDAIAPIVSADSLDMSIIFRGSRYAEADSENADSGDYLNCPMEKDEYLAFFNALLSAEKVASHDFEKEIHFEGCMPIEALAERGERTLLFGSLKPVGFTDPRTGRRPYAIMQLRAENAAATSYNLVGCQTKLTYQSQDAVFRLVPGLQHAEFLRHGSMHRNTYINAPLTLNPDGALIASPHIFPAGQISGVEGYVESAAHGLWVGLSLARRYTTNGTPSGQSLPLPPNITALGALLHHLQTPAKRFTPSNAHYGLMPELNEPIKKKERKARFAERGRGAWKSFLGGIIPPKPPYC